MGVPDGFGGVNACILLTKTRTEQARQVIREFEVTLLRTRDRIAQSRQAIIGNDKLIAELSRLVNLREDQTRE